MINFSSGKDNWASYLVVYHLANAVPGIYHLAIYTLVLCPDRQDYRHARPLEETLFLPALKVSAILAMSLV